MGFNSAFKGLNINGLHGSAHEMSCKNQTTRNMGKNAP